MGMLDKVSQPPSDWESSRSKFDSFIQRTPDIPEVMSNWNFFQAVTATFNFNYVLAHIDDRDLLLIIDLIRNIGRKNPIENEDQRIIEFIEKHIPSFGDIEFNTTATIKAFKIQLTSLVNRHKSFETESKPKAI